MDLTSQMHNDLVNAKNSFKIEKERFEKQQLEFEEMKIKFYESGG